MDIGPVLHDKNIRQYIMLGAGLLIGAAALYFFVLSDRPEDMAGAPAQAARKGAMKELPTEIFEDDKFKGLKETKVNWTKAEDLNIGNKNPFK